jgi:hypothetical protein
LAVPLVEGRIAAGLLGQIPGDAVYDILWIYKPEIGGRTDLVAVKLAPDADSITTTLIT